MNYEVCPKRENHKAHYLVLLFFMLAAVLLVVAGFMNRFSVLVQSLAILLLLPAIYITGKFLIMRYLYRVNVNEDGSVDFDVFSYRGGTKMQLICRLYLWEITEVRELCEENRRPAKSVPRYAYCADMSPKRALVLSVNNEDGACEVLISYDEKLAELLKTKQEPPVFDKEE